MKSYLKLAIISLMISLIASPLLRSQPVLAAPRWSAWAFQPDTRTALLFTESQPTPESYVLPLPAGTTRIQGSVAISHGWEYLAYVASNETGSRKLVIYNRALRMAVQTITLRPQTDYSLYSNQYDWQANEDSFSTDSSSLAFGYTLAGGRWSIDLYGVTTGISTTQLTSESPLVTALHIPATEGWTPVVQRYSNNQVIFTMANGSTVLPTHYDSYLWDITANTVTATNAYPMVNADTLQSTGETVAVGLDTHFPRNPNEGSTNVLLAYDPATRNSFPFYTTADAVLTSTTFIQNGERVVYTGFNAPSPQRHYTILERSGTVVRALNVPDIGDVIGWQDGLIYIAGAPGSAQSLNVLDTRSTGASPTVAWTGRANDPPLRLLQTPNNMQLSGTLVAFGHLDTPTVVSTGVAPTIVAANCPTPRLSIGGIGLVKPGLPNNIRSGPGTGNVIGQIPPEDIFDVLDGPICAANGILWWKINYHGVIGYTGEGQGNVYWVDPVGRDVVH